MKLIDDCNQLRFKLKSTPKTVQPDVERLQEQLKDTQEINVKLKLDLDSYKVISLIFCFQFIYEVCVHYSEIMLMYLTEINVKFLDTSVIGL